ncbi:MAG: acetoacetate decarboxylase family protein [Actinomycetota bacterium]
MLQTYLNDPSEGFVEYRAITDYVMVVFSDVQEMGSADPPDRRLGMVSEREVAFWTLTMDVRNEQLGWFLPYMWVDRGPPLANGREVYGWPKQLGRIEVNGEDRLQAAEPAFAQSMELPVDRHTLRVVGEEVRDFGRPEPPMLTPAELFRIEPKRIPTEKLAPELEEVPKAGLGPHDMKELAPGTAIRLDFTERERVGSVAIYWSVAQGTTAAIKVTLGDGASAMAQPTIYDLADRDATSSESVRTTIPFDDEGGIAAGWLEVEAVDHPIRLHQVAAYPHRPAEGLARDEPEGGPEWRRRWLRGGEALRNIIGLMSDLRLRTRMEGPAFGPYQAGAPTLRIRGPNSKPDRDLLNFFLLEALEQRNAASFLLDIPQVVVNGEVPLVFLKQIRDGVEPARACYQAILAANIEMRGFTAAGGGWLADPSVPDTGLELVTQNLDSNPFRRELGLSRRETVEYAFEMEFDFFVDTAQVIWERGANRQWSGRP